MVAPGLAGLETVLRPAQRRADRRPERDAGASAWETRSTTTSARIAAAPPGHWRSTWCSTATSEMSHAFGGELFAMHARRPRRREAGGDAAGADAFDVVVTIELRLPARPEPLPGGEGHVGGRAGRPARRHDRLAAECRDGFPDHGSYRDELASAASTEALLDAIAGRRRCPTSGRCRCRPDPVARVRVVMHTASSPQQTWPPPTSSRPPMSRTPSLRRCRPRVPTRACASCPRGRRPSPT